MRPCLTSIACITNGSKRRITIYPLSYLNISCCQMSIVTLKSISMLNINDISTQWIGANVSDKPSSIEALVAYKAFVSGGGTSLVRAASTVKANLKPEEFTDPDELVGYKLVLKACDQPFCQILENAGENGEVWLAKVLDNPSSHSIRYI